MGRRHVLRESVLSLTGLSPPYYTFPRTQPPHQAQRRRLSGTPVTSWVTFVLPFGLCLIKTRRHLRHRSLRR